ncbi:MAG: PVC-type heme-binding CxxCH protein, partial [Verrucomicrobiota bacterium]
LMLHEPLVAQPLFMMFDERDRLWVVQYRQYPFPAGLKMVSRDKYYRAVYDRTSPAPPKHFKGKDRISIHEDTDRDGRFDRHKVFLDGLSLVTSIAHAYGGVWVLNPPHLLCYRDRDKDDVPDGDPELHLTGFGIEDTHSTANSLTWGPDGWLYGAQGSTVSSHIKTVGSDDEAVYLESAGIWRYHPRQRKFEVINRGGGNTFSLEIDAKGRFFSGYNGGNSRGFHYVPGGIYLKGKGNKYGPPDNPYAFGHLPMMKHAAAPRFTHDFIIYEGVGLPERYRNRMFCLDPLHRRVVLTDRIGDGSTFRTEDVGFPVESEDPAFRPVDIVEAPDGSVFVADFYDYYIAHGQHFQGQIDPTSGRIYRIRTRDSKAFPKTPSKGFVDPSKVRRRTVQRLFAEDPELNFVDAEYMRKALREENDDQAALETLWMLHLAGALDKNSARLALKHPDPHVRVWAIRLMTDEDIYFDFTGADDSPLVRSQLAAGARRFEAEWGLNMTRDLLKHDADVDDPFIPLQNWWSIEARCESHPERVMALFDDPEFWRFQQVREHILPRLMRRFAATGKRLDLSRCAHLLNQAPSPEHVAKLMKGFEEAYQGRSLVGIPEALSRALLDKGRASLTLRLRTGDELAVTEALAAIRNNKTRASERLGLIETFGELGRPECVPVLMELIESSAAETVKRSALTTLAAYDRPEIGERVLKLYPDLPSALKKPAQLLLIGRAAWRKPFVEAIRSGGIPNELSPDIIDRLALTGDAEGIRDEGRIETRKEIERLKQVIAAGPGNPYEGRSIFLNLCGSCHRLYTEGGDIGPDLTPYQRDDLETMLLSIVDPGAEIREGYEQVLVTLKDGRTVGGFFADEDLSNVVVRDLAGGDIRLKREEIKNIDRPGVSLMPPNLTGALKDDQVRDLIAYLRSAQPIAR